LQVQGGELVVFRRLQLARRGRSDRNAWPKPNNRTNRELDIEIGRWGVLNNLNAQFVVQPHTVESNVFRFGVPGGLARFNSSLDWTPEKATFACRTADTRSKQISQHTFTGNVPDARGERASPRARINLWLLGGRPPSTVGDFVLVVSSFQFTPLP